MKKVFVLFLAVVMVLKLSQLVYAIPINVAIGKPVTASGTWYQGTTPDKAVDDDVMTRWVTPNFSGWLEVDLTTIYSIDTIEVVGIVSSDSFDGFKNYYTLEYRISGTDPWSLIGSGVFTQYYAPIDTWNLGGIAMRYVRYSVSPSSPGPLHWAHLSELRAFGEEPAPIPEPSTMLLLGSGLAGLVGLRRRLKFRST